MIEKILPKGEFSKNVLTLMTGTTIAQAIPVAISPILTRIYTPQDFGILALFVSITSIFGTIAAGRYELAIMLPEKDEDAINIAALGFIIVCIVTLFLFLVVLIFDDLIVKILNNVEIKPWLYFVPITVFFIGLWNILNYFNNRKKHYKDIATSTIIKSIVNAILSIIVGFLVKGAAGLVSGQIISQFFANKKLLKNTLKDKELVKKISKEKIIEQGKRYQNFPKYSLMAILANVLSYNITNILISTFYSVSTLGFYNLAQRILGMPSLLIGSSISQVFFQQAIKEKQETGRSIYTFNKTVKRLFFISLPMFTILFFIVEDLFAFVFGEKWRIAGSYAKILIPLFLIRFISSSVSIVLSIFEKQKMELLINILLILSSLILLFNISDFNKFLIYFSIVIGINYLLFLLYYSILSKAKI